MEQDFQSCPIHHRHHCRSVSVPRQFCHFGELEESYQMFHPHRHQLHFVLQRLLCDRHPSTKQLLQRRPRKEGVKALLLGLHHASEETVVVVTNLSCSVSLYQVSTMRSYLTLMLSERYHASRSVSGLHRC